ncbi:hypothetical protein CPB86DRAFT_783898 [Serendipita vermifera]|nr:hypothetical protein CPB86DRAFT_783898 [Serendipita vermifera]
MPTPQRTLFGNPNTQLVADAFQHLPPKWATQLRTHLTHILDQPWWRNNEAPPNSADLDKFISKASGKPQCLICDKTYQTNPPATRCVKKHLDITA